METIKVKLKDNPYNIYLEYNLTKRVPFFIEKLNLGNYGIILASQKVYSLYKKLLRGVFKKNYYFLPVIDGERAKSKKWLFKVINEIIKIDKWCRKIFLVCVGGGSITDLGGFVASIYKRGIPYVHIPTTLLCQIDASIGGKTAINLKEAKNILGTFHQPKAVFIDPIFLKTIAKKEIREGIAEAIKYGIIKDKSFFYFLKRYHREIISLETSYILKLIFTCAKIKTNIVEEDEKEKKGVRTLLNFGHTFAHALESTYRYRKVSHGEAVAIGMVFAAYLSYFMGKCSFNKVEEIKEIMHLFSLPIRFSFDYLTLYKSINYDKKFISGKIRMVLLKEIGKVEVAEDIPPMVLRECLKKFSRMRPKF